jgi:hypothetical protein
MDLPTSSLFSLSLTMTDNLAKRIIEYDLPFYEANIHVYTNAAKYGSSSNVDAVVNAGDVVWFTNGNLRDFMFMNNTAGANTKIVVAATVPTYYMKQLLK